ncbi:hypothetical protein TNCV_4053701 [Trichonephila clavipes]|nr:hypothetical protein TNCV_4053701 [Trichonephila clavipes]
MSCAVAHYPVGIWLMASAEFMGGPPAPTPQRCSVGCSVYRQRVLEGYDMSLNLNPTIVMLQAEAVSVSKHIVFSKHVSCPYWPFIAPLACGFQSRVNEAMDALWIFYSGANGVEWYERTPNDA